MTLPIAVVLVDAELTTAAFGDALPSPCWLTLSPEPMSWLSFMAMKASLAGIAGGLATVALGGEAAMNMDNAKSTKRRRHGVR